METHMDVVRREEVFKGVRYSQFVPLVRKSPAVARRIIEVVPSSTPCHRTYSQSTSGRPRIDMQTFLVAQ